MDLASQSIQRGRI